MKMDKEEEMAETISEEQAARMNALGKEILRTARNELYLKMRYLDVALSSLRFQMDGEIGSIGTDGQGLYFHPGLPGRPEECQPGLSPHRPALSVRASLSER